MTRAFFLQSCILASDIPRSSESLLTIFVFSVAFRKSPRVRIDFPLNRIAISGPMPTISSISDLILISGLLIRISGLYGGSGSGPGRHASPGDGGHLIYGEGGHTTIGDGGHTISGAGGQI